MKLDVVELSAAAAAAAQEPPTDVSAEHQAAHEHWRQCSQTRAAGDAYYQKTAKVLRDELLPQLGPVQRALDVGCGDGQFTLLIGELARSVHGIDLSPALIDLARERAAAEGFNRVHFECRDAESELPQGPYDLVACMGVLSTLVDEGPYQRLIAQLVDRVKPGGWLITKETVCETGDQLQKGGAYPIHYRHAKRYLQDLRQAGLELVSEFPLARWTALEANSLWLWRRAQAPSVQTVEERTGLEPGVMASDALEGLGAQVVVDKAAVCEAAAAPQASLDRLAEQQDRQSEVLLGIGEFLCDLGERLQRIEARLDATAAVDFKPLMARLDRLESTLHWSTRQPQDPRRGAIRVVFLIHHAAAWASLRGIVDAMQADPGFQPLVVSIPHRFPMLGQMGGELEVHQMLVEQGYPHVRVLDAEAEQALDRVKQLNPQVVFRQAPWDADVPNCLHSQNLSFTKLCYVPYGYMTAKIEKQQFDQLYHRLCWRIFCPDEAHQQLFAEHNLQAGPQCRVTGYPKFDHLLRHRQGAGHWPVAKLKPKAFRLLWAPHFSYEGNWLRFGVFDRMAEQMLAYTAAHSTVEVVLRPHPAMREAMAVASADSFLGRFRDRWSALPNAAVSHEQDYADLFAASHALLTDGLSFFSEYQLFDKPLVFFEREGHAGFNPAGERLLDGMYRVQTFAACQSLLATLRKGLEDKTIVAARRRIAASVHPFPGEAAKRILDVIRKDITGA
jgi:2-polyprenyl-3-methyl-5-hydroxy-6-metoxy-1,4-benzoquinol methylase